MASETTPPGQPVIDMGYLSLPAEVQQAVEADVAARRAPEAPAVPVTREQVREMVFAANEEGWWAQGGPASERVTDAIWPLLERAQAAACEPARDPLVMPRDEFAALKAVAEAAGEPPWTPEEVAGFRERFEATMARYAPLRVLPSDRWKDRAEAAEAKLAEVRAACRSIPSPIANRILAITGTEEPGDGA